MVGLAEISKWADFWLSSLFVIARGYNNSKLSYDE